MTVDFRRYPSELKTAPPHTTQQPWVNCGDLQVSGNYHFQRPEVGNQHQLQPKKVPAEVVLSLAMEEVWSATGAAEPALHRSHQIRSVHTRHNLVQSSHKTG